MISAGSILLGWIVLFTVTYLVQRPLLRWIAPLLGAMWLPTAQLALACSGLVATGWVIGRSNQADALPTVFVFAGMLGVANFGLEPAIDIPWLFRLVLDSFGSSRYLASLFTAVATDAVLMGSLAAGTVLSLRREQGGIHIFSPR